jgi:hypothetical protein
LATTALPWNTPSPYACATDAAFPTVVDELEAAFASASPPNAADHPDASDWPSSLEAAAVDTERDTSAAPATPALSESAFPSRVVAELASWVWLYRPPSE